MLRVEMKPGAMVRQMRPGATSSQAVGQRGEHQRMPNHGARCRREQSQTLRRLRRQRQREVCIAAAGRMVVNADAIEAGVLAAGDERRNFGQGAADGDAYGDAKRGHWTLVPIVPTELRQER